jgi:hypothetical protein
LWIPSSLSLQHHRHLQDSDDDTILSSIARSFTDIAISFNYSWPFVTSPVFEGLAQSFVESSPIDRVVVLFCPLVSAQLKGTWEAYSFATHEEWTGTSSETLISPFVYRIDDNAIVAAETGASYYCPLWQHYPVTIVLVNWDVLTINSTVAGAVDAVVKSGEPSRVAGTMTQLNPDKVNEFLVHPIFNVDQQQQGGGRVVVGVVIGVVATVTVAPSPNPTAAVPTEPPSRPPSVSPTSVPSSAPSSRPSNQPSDSSNATPSVSPSEMPSDSPGERPLSDSATGEPPEESSSARRKIEGTLLLVGWTALVVFWRAG